MNASILNVSVFMTEEDNMRYRQIPLSGITDNNRILISNHCGDFTGADLHTVQTCSFWMEGVIMVSKNLTCIQYRLAASGWRGYHGK